MTLMEDEVADSFAGLFPNINVELKFGIERSTYSLPVLESDRDTFCYGNEWIKLHGRRENLDTGIRYTLSLENVGKKSFRITRLRFPAEGGLDAFLDGADPRRVAFLRNGYQSWSTVRSYRMHEKPLRPWLKLLSLATSNMANLPSNRPGQLSSETYAIIVNLEDGRSFLVGQESPFDQFFYVILTVDPTGRSYFEMVYDFGRQMIEPRTSIGLDSIVFRYGTRPFVEQSYFYGLREQLEYTPPPQRPSGWCSWYQYYDKISPEILYKNLQTITSRGLKLDVFQIDDGWQTKVGDWTKPNRKFDGHMKELADAIKSAGMKPGIWLAPFSVDGRSELARLHPEYILKNEYGRRLVAGFNPVWKSFYYGLDATHPRFAEYLDEFIGTIVEEWGFEVLKCDFLFSACLRGAVHHDLGLSRASVLKTGMKSIRRRAGPEVELMGCGMPISAGIGLVDSMRVGPDTGDFWVRMSGKLLNTGSMLGVRNSLRNMMVRSPMHKRIWLNDPDCAILRDRDSHLRPAERMSQLDAIALSGGMLLFSDDFSALSSEAWADLKLVFEVSDQCFKGQAIAIDVMEKEIPEVFYNTAGYVGFFNFRHAGNRAFDLSSLREYEPDLSCLVDQHSGERIAAAESLELKAMPRHGSRLFRIERSCE